MIKEKHMITLHEMLEYTAFAANRKEVLGNEIKEPYLLEKEDLRPWSDPVDHWIQALSAKYKATGSAEIRKLLLKFENYRCVDEADFRLLESVM